MMSFEEFLNSLPTDNNLKGRAFEIATKWWLENDPIWSSQLKKVWLWESFPKKTGRDTGIDLVAESLDGDFLAIQCKAYDPSSNLKKSDIDSFLSASNRKLYKGRILVTTTKSVGNNARETLGAQEKPVHIVDWVRLQESKVDWSLINNKSELVRPKKTLRSHQARALEAVSLGFKNSDKGQLIMACGTGKTLTALRISEKLKPKTTIVAVPSLTLLSQTLADWLVEREVDFKWLAVCSDETVANDPADSTKLIDYDFPVTTDIQEIRKFLESSGRKVIFTTYHSSPRLAEALRSSGSSVDLLIADEAHRLAGKTTSDFSSLVKDSDLSIKKRLFMTATPRFFSTSVKKSAESDGLEILSMDDANTFGPEFFSYDFTSAIKDGVLSDFQVVIVGVSDRDVQESVTARTLVKAGVVETDAESLALHIAISKSIKKWNLRRSISFHSRVSKARKFANDQVLINQWLPEEYRIPGTFHATTISSNMPTDRRRDLLNDLKNLKDNESLLISNARCLTEGIDVPTLDAVVFVDPKTSQVDIIQAVGRAIRLGGKSKTHVTVIIPVFIGKNNKDGAIDKSAFAKIGQVLNALRAHDEKLGEQLDQLRQELGERGVIESGIERITWDLPTNVSPSVASAIEAVAIENSTTNWDFMYGLLKRFIKREGHVLVPSDQLELGAQLGRWLGNQRGTYRSGFLSEDRISLLESIHPSWTWDPVDESWQQNYQLLKDYLRVYGTTSVPANSDFKSVALGNWVAAQRSRLRQNLLSQERKEALEALPTWKWNPVDEKWEKNFEALIAFVDQFGTTRVPIGFKSGTLALGKWISHQREDWKRGKLGVNQISRLENSGSDWSWNPSKDVWEEGFAIYKEYLEENKSARIPNNIVMNGFNLGTWVANQKIRHRQGKLSQDKVTKLEKSHSLWTWSLKDSLWDEYFNELKRYFEEYGHSDHPYKVQGKKSNLGEWIVTQRKALVKGKMTKERKALLDSINFRWVSLDPWEEGFSDLLQFVKREGHARVHWQHKENERVLGKWVSHQRAKYKAGQLSADQIERLESLTDWDWAPTLKNRS